MANKLGTIVEDLVHPSMVRLMQETLGEETVDLTIRHKRRLPDGRVQEFDALAATPTQVVLNSTKATLRSADVDAMIPHIRLTGAAWPGRPGLCSSPGNHDSGGGRGAGAPLP